MMEKPTFAELLSKVQTDVSFAQDKITASELYIEGKYKECLSFIDSCYGWPPGELEHKLSDKEEAENALKAMGVVITRRGNHARKD